ncbi:MAG: hypothetical protein PHR06_10500, partial [Candidatus Cloacimonetes bacterium]|nr:hypothetical protein [Candidatus Cloacimonadota bacterium]
MVDRNRVIKKAQELRRFDLLRLNLFSYVERLPQSLVAESASNQIFIHSTLTDKIKNLMLNESHGFFDDDGYIT